MRVSHVFTPVFDDPNLVSAAGLVPVLELAEQAGLSHLLAEQLSVPSPNRTVKARTVIAGMLAGADDIDGLDVLRAGGMKCVVAGVRAPSTVGTFLRTMTHGHVLQLAAVNRGLMEGLCCHLPSLLGSSSMVFLDLDDTIRQTHGYAKQGAAYGYSKVKGLNAIIAAVSTDHTLPVIVEAGLRKGNARSGDSAEWYASRALNTIGKIAPDRQVLARADSAFCTHGHVAAVIDAGGWFSFTIPQWPTVHAAIAAIPDEDWTGIEYPEAVWDEQAGGWVSDAEVAETEFTAFTARRKDERIACRLVVRRVKRLGGNANHGQDTLFDTYRHHAFITNSTLDTIEADRRHRGHAVIEQVVSELKDGPLAHLPSGRFGANAAWLQLAVTAFNLSRAAAHAAGIATARMATILARIIRVPARLASRARRLTAHLPQRWPYATAWMRLWDTALGPPGHGLT